MTYSILKISGKQFIIKPNYWYDIDYLKNLNFLNLKPLICFKQILFFKKDLFIQIGQPFLKNTMIFGKILQKIKGNKILILKTKPKKKYTKTAGHRQFYTRVFIF